jgi:hypothetical protein
LDSIARKKGTRSPMDCQGPSCLEVYLVPLWTRCG